MAAFNYQSPWETPEVRMYRDMVRDFIKREFVPHQKRWQMLHRPDGEAWTRAGEVGLLLPDIPEQYGGGGGSYAQEVAVVEELARAGVHFGSGIQSIVAHYILAYGTEQQKKAWLPAMARGELVASIAMTEPGAGSDLQAIQTRATRMGDEYRIKGSKNFITNASHAGLICLAARTSPRESKGPALRALSLIMVDARQAAGYSVGAPLEKVGMHGQDTCELFFDDVRVPAENLLGPAEGHGFLQMMEQLPYERLSIAAGAVASIERAVELTTRHAKERRVAGKPMLDLQNTRFKLAECKTEAHIGRVFLDSCIARFMAGQLDDATAAMAKYWLTECQCRIVDECVQLHGGYGYMTEYPIARMWADSRVQRIYAGTNEVMKELVAWSL